MNYKTIKKESLECKKWSGGTTTQLFISPKDADYGKRNFSFRLSTATVEVEKSDFTALPGVSRKLMILDGKIDIAHQNHHSKQLNKFDVDDFEGDWNTSSVGRCTDFNLMTTGNTKGEIKAIAIGKKEETSYKIASSNNWLFIYAFSGKISVNINEAREILNEGDSIAIENASGCNIGITGIENSELVFAEVRQK